MYNKVDKVEELTLKGDFVQNLIKLHTTNSINTRNEEYVKQAHKEYEDYLKQQDLLAPLHIGDTFDYTPKTE